jgi:Clostridial hydrophobic W
MSDAPHATPPKQAVPAGAAPAPRDQDAAGAQGRVAELRVSGHLMTLETGLFCVFPVPGSPTPDPVSGLPGVRVSLAPGLGARSDAVSISTFRDDGWLDGTAALVRVSEGPAQILVTIYQSPRQSADTAPKLQVMRLSAEPAEAPAAASAAVAAPPPAAGEADPEIVAHVQRTGDVAGKLGDWIGKRGSRMWIEGFGVAPGSIAPEDLEYQAVLGRGWLSPWVAGGKFCGSRGMALPLLGLNVRLKGDAAKTFECHYSATFVDGSTAGPVAAGEACEAESLSALEAFQIEIVPKAGRAGKPAARAVRPTKPAASRR